MNIQVPSVESADAHQPDPALLPLPNDDDALVRAQDVSRYTGIARQTHARWRHEGVGPQFVLLGRRVFYRAGDLRAWIRSRVRQNTIEP